MDEFQPDGMTGRSNMKDILGIGIKDRMQPIKKFLCATVQNINFATVSMSRRVIGASQYSTPTFLQASRIISTCAGDVVV